MRGTTGEAAQIRISRTLAALLVAQLLLNIVAWCATAWWGIEAHRSAVQAREAVRDWWLIDTRNMWRTLDALAAEHEGVTVHGRPKSETTDEEGDLLREAPRGGQDLQRPGAVPER